MARNSESHMPSPAQALAAALSIWIAVTDLYARRVPNHWLGFAMLLGGTWLCITWLAGMAPFPISALGGLAVGLLVLLPFYLVGWMGAGDVKFFAVIGFLLGWRALLPIWIVAGLLAGAYALAILLARRVPALRNPMADTECWRKMIAARQGRVGIPYAACLAGGALLALAYTGEGHSHGH